MKVLLTCVVSILLVTDSIAHICYIDGVSVPFDQTQICCNGTIVKKHLGDEVRGCCNGTDLYLKRRSICCGNELFPKDDPMTECCGKSPFVRSRSTRCCGNSERNLHLYKNVGEYDGCCKSALIDKRQFRCCEDRAGNVRRHRVQISKDCCGVQYYNTSTHHCDIDNEVARPLFRFLCENETYDERFNTCCQGKLHAGKSNCCGPDPMDGNLKRCCADKYQIDRNKRCCGKSDTGYNTLTELCCGPPGNEVIQEKGNKFHQCCGTQLYNSDTEICCLNEEIGTIANKSEYKICRNETSCSFVKVGDICCGAEKLNVNNVCCEAGYGFRKYTFQKEKEQPHHDGCCTSTRPIKEFAKSYSKAIHYCDRSWNQTLIVTKTGSYCNGEQYNRQQDLCCGGRLYRRAVIQGKTICCGRQPYKENTQSCCGNKVVNRKRCSMDNEIPEEPVHRCPVVCSNDEKMVMRKIRTSHLKFCKLYGYKVIIRKVRSVGRDSMFVVKYPGKIFLHRSQGDSKPKSRVKKIYLPCHCPEHYTAVIVLTSKPRSRARLILDEDDLLIPYTSRIRRKLRYVWRKKCQIPTALITEDLVDDIFSFIKMKIRKQKQAWG